jgi:hypothetical protein
VPGRRGGGRSKQRPYGVMLRQGASGSRKREQAPALQRNVVVLNLEIGGREDREGQRSRATAGLAEVADEDDVAGFFASSQEQVFAVAGPGEIED